LNKHPKDFANYKIEFESIEGGVEGSIRKSKKQHAYSASISNYKIFGHEGYKKNDLQFKFIKDFILYFVKG
jgi:hypothetical protein